MKLKLPKLSEGLQQVTVPQGGSFGNVLGSTQAGFGMGSQITQMTGGADMGIATAVGTLGGLAMGLYNKQKMDAEKAMVENQNKFVNSQNINNGGVEQFQQKRLFTPLAEKGMKVQQPQKQRIERAPLNQYGQQKQAKKEAVMSKLKQIHDSLQDPAQKQGVADLALKVHNGEISEDQAEEIINSAMGGQEGEARHGVDPDRSMMVEAEGDELIVDSKTGQVKELLKGPSHDGGGIKLPVEDGEAIIPKNKKEQYLNTDEKGKKGIINTLPVEPVDKAEDGVNNDPFKKLHDQAVAKGYRPGSYEYERMVKQGLDAQGIKSDNSGNYHNPNTNLNYSPLNISFNPPQAESSPVDFNQPPQFNIEGKDQSSNPLVKPIMIPPQSNPDLSSMGNQIQTPGLQLPNSPLNPNPQNNANTTPIGINPVTTNNPLISPNNPTTNSSDQKTTINKSAEVNLNGKLNSPTNYLAKAGELMPTMYNLGRFMFDKPNTIQTPPLKLDRLNYQDMSDPARLRAEQSNYANQQVVQNLSGGEAGNVRAGMQMSNLNTADQLRDINNAEIGRYDQVQKANVDIANQERNYNQQQMLADRDLNMKNKANYEKFLTQGLTGLAQKSSATIADDYTKQKDALQYAEMRRFNDASLAERNRSNTLKFQMALMDALQHTSANNYAQEYTQRSGVSPLGWMNPQAYIQSLAGIRAPGSVAGGSVEATNPSTSPSLPQGGTMYPLKLTGIGTQDPPVNTTPSGLYPDTGIYPNSPQLPRYKKGGKFVLKKPKKK